MNCKTFILLGVLALASCQGDLDHIVPEPPPEPPVHAINLDVVGGVAEALSGGLRFFVKGKYGGLEVDHEPLAIAPMDCPWLMKIRVNKGVLSYELKPHDRARHPKEHSDRCAQHYRDAMDSKLRERVSNVGTY